MFKAVLDRLSQTDERIKFACLILDKCIEETDDDPIARHQAVLELVYDRYRSCDQPGLDALLLVAPLYGFKLDASELVAQLERCTEIVVSWWMEPCIDCGPDH